MKVPEIVCGVQLDRRGEETPACSGGRFLLCRSVTGVGRGERIRTSGPYVPNVVLYQAELLPGEGPPETTAAGRLYSGSTSRLQRRKARPDFAEVPSLPRRHCSDQSRTTNTEAFA